MDQVNGLGAAAAGLLSVCVGGYLHDLIRARDSEGDLKTVVEISVLAIAVMLMVSQRRASRVATHYARKMLDMVARGEGR